MRGRGRNLSDRKLLDLFKRKGPVARKTLVLRRDLPRLVGELPRRISQYGREASLAGKAQQIQPNRIHLGRLRALGTKREHTLAYDSCLADLSDSSAGSIHAPLDGVAPSADAPSSDNGMSQTGKRSGFAAT